MATLHIDAHCLDEIRDELKARNITVTEVDPPWDYLFTGERAALEKMLEDFWGLEGEDLASAVAAIND